jgi:hypothetical protein
LKQLIKDYLGLVRSSEFTIAVRLVGATVVSAKVSKSLSKISGAPAF